MCFDIIVSNLLSTYVDNVTGLYISPLTYICILSSISHCLVYYCFIISLEIR